MLSERQYFELGKFFIDLAKGILVGMFGFAIFSQTVSNYFVLYVVSTGVVGIACVTIGLVLIERDKNVKP
jgi:uncharacterized membrane protein